MSLSPLPPLAPELALLAATLGVLLVFLELNRPGRILPGTTGVLLFLFATASLLHHPLRPWALLAVAVAALTLALNLYRPIPSPLLAAGTLTLVLGLRFLLASAPATRPIHTATALFCGTALGVSAAVLSRIAFRARRAKAVH